MKRIWRWLDDPFNAVFAEGIMIGVAFSCIVFVCLVTVVVDKINGGY